MLPVKENVGNKRTDIISTSQNPFQISKMPLTLSLVVTDPS